jgi:hypothetical protein
LAVHKTAVIVLAALRHDQRLADLAGGKAISCTTVSRWVKEVIRLLSAKAQRLERVLKKIARKGGSVVLLDGTLIRTQRRAGAEMRRRYSGKHKCHGLLFIALTDTKGRLLWTAATKPGRASEITASRHNNLVERLQEAGLGAIADLGFVGLDKDPENPAIITG